MCWRGLADSFCSRLLRPYLERRRRRRKPDKPTRRVIEVARTSKLGSQLRFDLSKDALRGRRSKTDLAR